MGRYKSAPHGNVRSNSGEFIRELVKSGVGLGLLSTWDIGAALRSGTLRWCCRNFAGRRTRRSTRSIPSREFMPAKVNVFIEFLADLYGSHPYWDKDLDLPRSPRAGWRRGRCRGGWRRAPDRPWRRAESRATLDCKCVLNASCAFLA